VGPLKLNAQMLSGEKSHVTLSAGDESFDESLAISVSQGWDLLHLAPAE